MELQILVVCVFVIGLVLCNSVADETHSVNLNGVSGIIAAYGDFNGDKYTDIFVVTQDCMFIFSLYNFFFC